MKVIICDDEEKVCLLIEKLVDWSAFGAERPAIVHSSYDAIRLAEQLMPDLVITDIRMPGCSGIEMMQIIKRVCPATEFIMVSGWYQTRDFQHVGECDVTDYLLKPINKKELLSAVKKVHERYLLKNRESASGNMAPEARPEGEAGSPAQLFAYLSEPCSASDLCPPARNDAACRADLTAYFCIQIRLPRRYIRMMPQINLIIRIDFFYQQRQFEKVSGSMISSNNQLRRILPQRLYSARNRLSFRALYIHFDSGNAPAA